MSSAFKLDSDNIFLKFLIKQLKFLIENHSNLFLKFRVYLVYIPKPLKQIINKIKSNIFKPPVFLISFPKSGRTWLRLMIRKSICEIFNYSDKFALDITKITKAAGLNPLFLTHDQCSTQKLISYHELTEDKSKYKGKKVILLTCNIKDILVSQYFQAIKRENNYQGTISEFIRNDYYGVKKIIKFYNIWHKNRKVPDSFLLLKYEDMHKDPRAILIKTLRFIGIENINRKIIEKVVNFTSFNNMKKLERDNYFNNKALRPEKVSDEESYKVRKGIIGGYVDYLNSEDIEYIDNILRKRGNSFKV